MTKIAVMIMLATMMLMAAGAVQAAQTIYGISGLIQVPDETTLAPGSIGLTAHFADDDDASVTTFGGGIGIVPKFEAAVVGYDIEHGDTEAVFSAKYRILDETISSPSITVGVVDLTDELSDDPSFFLVIGKNITATAEQISGSVSKPLRGYLGVGSGIYDGVFVGLNWSLAPKFDVLGEYISENTVFNAALRYTPVAPFSIQAGTLDFDGFYIGASYNLATY